LKDRLERDPYTPLLGNLQADNALSNIRNIFITYWLVDTPPINKYAKIASQEGTVTIECPKCHYENPDDTLYCGKCGTPLKHTEDISATKTLETAKEEVTTGSTFAGRYQIIEELGKGGMGRVYKVMDKDVNAKIALKLIKPEISADKKIIERFRNELKTARKISHKNICRMYDLNKEAGFYYITMEFVPGEDLKSMIKMSGRLAVGTTISIAKQICEGLSANSGAFRSLIPIYSGH
jgi:hypothetical protein